MLLLFGNISSQLEIIVSECFCPVRQSWILSCFKAPFCRFERFIKHFSNSIFITKVSYKVVKSKIKNLIPSDTCWKQVFRNLKYCRTGSRYPHFSVWMWNPLIEICMVLIQNSILCFSIVTSNNCW